LRGLAARGCAVGLRRSNSWSQTTRFFGCGSAAFVSLHWESREDFAMKILIVDDSLTQAQHLTKILTDIGHQVVGHARTGAAGIMLFKERTPDLVFLDIVMPEMDGLTALRTMRSIDPKAHVILLTSLAGVGGKVEEALQLGAADVLAKPCSRVDIRRAINKLANSSEKP
jgi:two-component system chemotaxis response regulator CheY